MNKKLIIKTAMKKDGKGGMVVPNGMMKNQLPKSKQMPEPLLNQTTPMMKLPDSLKLEQLKNSIPLKTSFPAPSMKRPIYNRPTRKLA